MANHGYVNTKLKLTPEAVSEVIEELNQRLFKGNLKVEYIISTKDDPSWGKYTWMLSYESERQVWAERICWFDRSNRFEMRHGGGSNFAWWVDSAILNEIAVKFNGKVRDDGHEGVIHSEAGKYDNAHLFLEQWVECFPEDKQEEYLNLVYQFVPKEFQRS